MSLELKMINYVAHKTLMNSNRQLIVKIDKRHICIHDSNDL